MFHFKKAIKEINRMNNTKDNNIIVLMSTFNGESFLKEQIDSILEQDVNVRLIVRDDGSIDNTLHILEENQQAQRLSYYTGKNLGPHYSFLDLLKKSPDSDFYAYADQDDVWEKEKLSTAINMLDTAKEKPALYFSNTLLTDENLNPIPSKRINPYLTFGESLIYEFIPGCTMVMNKALRDIVNTYQPDYIPMHDVWIYSIAQAIGAKIFFDKQPHILYRQHSNNTIGQGYSIWHEWKRRWQRFICDEQSRSRRAIEIRKGFSSYISSQNASLLDSFIDGKQSFIKRINLITNPKLRCANPTTQLLFWINLLINKY